MPTTLLTTKEAAKKLRISPWGVRDLIRNGKLPHIKLGHRTLRFREQDLETWLAKRVKL